ncbi:MAG: DegT/DnrJ/EryC1/StrS family aminotransferase [Gammaproteobacteria bacterium]|nr:MAG: DegT/DnrJ/EryC1/StrS family aminotransferase [Gammaproteobacteria bacterium]
MINVTKTYLPDKKKYLAYVDKIYASGWVTNNGPLVRELEERLAEHLGVNNLVLVANGTIALEIAYRLLKLKGEVITTPFSFVATTSSLVSNGLQPVFADIDPASFNINPENIAGAVSPSTSAIVPVHVFGNSCDVDEICKIASRYQLKVIYDAAHAFGVKYKGESILRHGDVSTLSFHATKQFHTIEGGALVINDDTLVQEARYLINFGIDGPDSVKALGTNAKMNEFEAAMGLCILDDMGVLHQRREELFEIYKLSLSEHIQCQVLNSACTKNYGYFPVLFENESQTLQVKTALNEAEIFPRRYFFPSLDTLGYLKTKQVMPFSRDVASRVLCLPIYPELKKTEQKIICDVIKRIIDKGRRILSAHNSE